MISVIIVTGKCSIAFACNNPSDNITEIRYFGTVRLLRPKQNKVLCVNMEYMDLLPPTAPSLVFARETCTPYYTNTSGRVTSNVHELIRCISPQHVFRIIIISQGNVTKYNKLHKVPQRSARPMCGMETEGNVPVYRHEIGTRIRF